MWQCLYPQDCILIWIYRTKINYITLHHNTSLSLWSKCLISNAVLHVHVTGTVRSVRTCVWCRRPHNCRLSMRSLLLHTFTAYSQYESLQPFGCLFRKWHRKSKKYKNRFRFRKENTYFKLTSTFMGSWSLSFFYFILCCPFYNQTEVKARENRHMEFPATNWHPL